MKNFFGSRKNVISVSTICVVLLTMIAVTHYYLQYDIRGAIGWTLTFGYLFLLVQSVSTLGYGWVNKKSDIKLLGVEITVLSVLMLVYAIMSVIPLMSALYVKAAGLIIPLVLIPAFADKAITEKPLVKKLWYVIPAAVVAVAAVVLSDMAIDEADMGSKILYIIGALFCVFGIILSIVNIAKKKNELFAWALMMYSFLGALMFVLKIFEKITLAEKFLSLQNLGASVMLIAVISAEQIPSAVKRRRR